MGIKLGVGLGGARSQSMRRDDCGDARGLEQETLGGEVG